MKEKSRKDKNKRARPRSQVNRQGNAQGIWSMKRVREAEWYTKGRLRCLPFMPTDAF
jgi:hypothetical protein